MIKKYLLCIEKSCSHVGPINYICEKLRHDHTTEIELFIASETTTINGIFGDQDDDETCRIINECKLSIETRQITNKISKKYHKGSLDKGLKDAVLSDSNQEISAIILGFSKDDNSQTIFTLIKSLGVVTIPIIIIPESITHEQILKVI